MYKIGDTVCLKSGSPDMTVIKRLISGYDDNKGWVRVAFFNDEKQRITVFDLPPEALLASSMVRDIIDEALAEIDQVEATYRVARTAAVAVHSAGDAEPDELSEDEEFEGKSALTDYERLVDDHIA